MRALIAVALDEEAARGGGLAGCRSLNALISMLAALTIGVSMRIVGILLNRSAEVLPVVAAQLVAWSVRSTIAISIGFGLAAVLVGLPCRTTATSRRAARSSSRAPASSCWRRRPPSSDADHEVRLVGSAT